MTYGSYGKSEATCRSCGARILFKKTKKGHMMPVDPAIVNYKIVPNGPEKVLAEDGVVVSCRTDVTAEEADGFGHVSHFATCPNAAKHRKGKSK